MFSFYLPFYSCLRATCPAQQVTFNRVLPPEGSYFGLINGISQDPHGYMWFSAYGVGLQRYDGYHLITYQNDPLNPGSLATNNVECVYADHSGIIWIGTSGSGLDRLDPATGIFTHFLHKNENQNSLSDNRVTAILEDHNGTIWAGTENGLNRFDQKTETFTRYQQNPNDTTSLSCNHVQVLYEDRQGTLWVGTGSPQRFYSSNDKGGPQPL